MIEYPGIGIFLLLIDTILEKIPEYLFTLLASRASHIQYLFAENISFTIILQSQTLYTLKRLSKVFLRLVKASRSSRPASLV
jgi:hypothetical protein